MAVDKGDPQLTMNSEPMGGIHILHIPRVKASYVLHPDDT